ncbi:hypothetical protein FQR65_LT09299 [Abscondita terminalis]|nr:hypothetical protein FQR65_LT09299 [Abscondita terminalis]
MVTDTHNSYKQPLRLLENRLLEKCEAIKTNTKIWFEDTENGVKQTKNEQQKLENQLKEFAVQENTGTPILVNKNLESLEQLTLDLIQLENREAKLMQEIAKVKLKFNNLKKTETDKLEAQIKAVQKYRDMCKSSKELTKTVFHYQSSNISGFILSENESVQVFNLNPNNLTPDQMTKCIWKYMDMASASCSNGSAIVLKK